MDDTLLCPGCQARLTMPALPPGQTVQCPRCQVVFEPPRMPSAAPVASSRRAAPHDASDNLAEPPPVSRDRLTQIEPLRGEWKAFAAMFLLGISVLSYGVQLYLNYERMELMHFEDGRRGFDLEGRAIREHRFTRWQHLSRVANQVHHATFWPAMLFFLFWLIQAVNNLKTLQVAGLWYTPNTAVLSFFLPIVNLFQPHAAVQEIWKASDPVGAGTTSWITGPASSLIRIWWAAYLASWLFSVLAVLKEPNDLHGEAHSAATQSRCVSNGCMMLAGVLLIFIIRGIMQRQAERYIRLYEDPD
jgi:hypothetical protein